jgi:DNA ligase (NAD+)
MPDIMPDELDLTTDPETLAAWLKACSERYYNTGDSPLEDTEFDQLLEKLRTLSPDHPFLAEVGAVPAGRGLEHRIPMGSLEKLKNEEQLKRWYENVGRPVLAVQWKHDGISLSLEYEKGTLVRVLTRGDGKTGEDITANMKRSFHGEALNQLKTPFTGSVRSEAVIHHEDFAKHFRGESNPRNSALGSAKKTDSEKVRWVRVVCYDAVNHVIWATELEKVEFMVGLGLPTAETKLVKDVDELLVFYKEAQERRKTLPFMADGLVLKINDLNKQKVLGERDMRPCGQRALKFPNQSAVSTLRAVELAVGHTGTITLRGVYDPVKIDGRVFRHTNLDNFDALARLGVQLGDEVVVEVAGDIIPRVTRLNKPGAVRTPIVEPTVCPVCGEPVSRAVIRTGRGSALKCLNEDCPARGVRQLRHFVATIDTKHLGTKSLEHLYVIGLVRRPGDLYRLTQETLGPAIGDGNARRVLAELDEKRELSLDVLLASLGVPGLGKSVAQKIMSLAGGVLEKVKTLTENPECLSGSFCDVAKALNARWDDVEDLLNAGVKVKTRVTSDANTAASGKTFVITGTLSAPRKKVQQKIEDAGGIVKGSIGRSLDFLVVGTDAGSKLDRAKELGVKTITEQELDALLS